ncbi:MAG: hypothetical protein KME11_04900 [Timaviella obliquedivisa GSE-PSE-MK23-08B]|nr:hypothetical protein [Timaviella obliquedivisa GSE-PSE-MK23-08B]
MELQNILNERFKTYQDAITKHGQECLLIHELPKEPVGSVNPVSHFSTTRLQLIPSLDGWQYVVSQ